MNERQFLAKELASKLKVVEDGVVVSADLNLTKYGITPKEAILFAIICDNFKNNRTRRLDRLVGKYSFECLKDIIDGVCQLRFLCYVITIDKNEEQLIFPSFADKTEIDEQVKNFIPESILNKAIDYLLKQEKTLCSENRLINILDFIIDHCSGDFCTGCEHLSEDKEIMCLSRGDSIDCRNGLLERIANGTLSPNGKGGAK